MSAGKSLRRRFCSAARVHKRQSLTDETQKRGIIDTEYSLMDKLSYIIWGARLNLLFTILKKYSI